MVNKITNADRDDAHRICRSCLRKSSKLISLAKSCSQINIIDHGLADCHESIANLMMSCANIQVDVDDGLPQNICGECFIDISAAIVYRRKCEESDKELRQIFHDDFLNVSVKEEMRSDSPIETQAVNEHHWFEMNDTEMDGEVGKASDQGDSNSMTFNDWNGSVNSLDEPQIKSDDARKKFICETCSKSFNKKYNWKQHQLVHTGEKNFVCHVCNQEYKSRQNLKRHCIKHHDGDIGPLGSNGDTHRVEFKHEDTHFDVEKRAEEQDSSNENDKPPFACDICAKVFSRRFNLKQHQLIHSARTNYTCDICGRQFTDKSVLSFHLDNHIRQSNQQIIGNADAPETPSQQNVVATRKKKSDKRRKKACEYCSKVFDRTFNLNRHILTHIGVKQTSRKERNETNECQTEVKIPIEADAFEEHSPSQHQDQPHKKKVCQICSKEFNRSYNLKQHLMIHTGQNQFPCATCQRVYKTKKSLHVHEEQHKKLPGKSDATESNVEISYDPQLRRIRKFVCDVCAKSFKNLNNFHQHQLVHSNVRDFICDICERRFKTKNHLKNHMRIHDGGSGLYSHLCSECGSRYQNATRLAEHMRQHSGERPFECDVCQKTFQRLYNLTCHKRIHAPVKPYQCTLCDRGFTIKDKLRVHMMVHTGERPYKCTVCSAGFVQGCLLKVHMRTHTGEMPYLCLCGLRFQHRSQILKHRRQFNHFETKNPDQDQSNNPKTEPYL